MSTEKSEKKLRKEAGALLEKIDSNLSKLSDLLGDNYDNYSIAGKRSVSSIHMQLKQLKTWQADPKIPASMYMSAVENINNLLNTTMESRSVKESRISARLSRGGTTILRKQELGNEQTAKMESEPKAVEAKQEGLKEAGTGQTAKKESEANAAEAGQLEEEDEYIIPGEEKVATKIGGHDAGAEQAEQGVEDDDDVIFLKPDPGEEKVAAKIEEHGAKAELGESKEEEVENMLDKLFDDKINPGEVQEAVRDMEAKLAAMKSTGPKVEAVMKGEDTPQTVDSNKSEQHKVDDVEASRQKLRAIHAGQLRNDKGKEEADRGQKIKTETTLQGQADEAKQPVKNRKPAKMSEADSFDIILSHATNIEKLNVGDKINLLRVAVDNIKNQPNFKQYEAEQGAGKGKNVQAGLDAIETMGAVHGINEPRVDTKANEKFASKPALVPDQKAAYKAISKLDELLAKVEKLEEAKFKVGMIKSIRKGEVRDLLENLNNDPSLKKSIKETADRTRPNTQKAEVTHQGPSSGK